MLTKTLQLKIIKIIRFVIAVAITLSILLISFYFNIFYSALSGISNSSSPEEYYYRLAFIIFGVFLLTLPVLLIAGFILIRNLNTKINKDIRPMSYYKHKSNI